MRLVAGSLLVLLACSGAALGADARDQRVRHGEGIGKIHLGMTPGAVQRALGRDAILVRRERRSRGRIYAEYHWDMGWWAVGFLGPPGRLRVVQVSTLSRRQRSPEGLGVDSTEDQVTRKLPARCAWVWPPNGGPGHPECVYRLPNGRQTVFIFDRWAGHYDREPVSRVSIVEVRARGCDHWARNCRAR
jgi:hypothetical protein